MAVEPHPSSPSFIRPRKTTDKAKTLPDLSTLSISKVPGPLTHRDSSSKAPFPLFRPRKTPDRSRALEPNSDVVMGPTPVAELTSETSSSPISVPMVFRPRKTADNSKILPTSPISSHTPHISPTMDVHYPPIIPMGVPISSVTSAPFIASATPLVPDEPFGRLRMAPYAHAAAVRAFVKSITLPRFRHHVDDIPYTFPAGVSSTTARYPGLSLGGRSSHIYAGSAFMGCHLQADVQPLLHPDIRPLHRRFTGQYYHHLHLHFCPRRQTQTLPPFLTLNVIPTS